MPTMLQLDAEVEPVFDALHEVLPLIAEAVRHARSDEPLYFPAVEALVADLSAAFERAVLNAIVAACDRTSPLKTQYGQTLRVRCRRAVTLFSRSGPITVVRSIYAPDGSSSGNTYDPVSVRCGALGHWLPATSAAMAMLVEHVPQREAQEISSHLRLLPYAASSFWKQTQAIGKLYMEHQEAVEEQCVRAVTVPEKTAGIVLSIDRVSLPVEYPRKRPPGRPKKNAAKRPIERVFEMAYCATMSWHDSLGKTLGTIRYARMPDESIDELCDALRDDCKAALAQRPELAVSVVCDGAHEFWNAADRAFSADNIDAPVKLLVDFWHLLEKVGRAMVARWGKERGAREIACWRLRLLNDSSAWKILLDHIVRWRREEQASSKERPVHDAVTYLRNHGEAGRLDYAKARREGRPVGSGPVEATCKTVVEVRMKRCGTRWKHKNAARFIRLRAAARSGRWQLVIDTLLRIHTQQFGGLAAA